MSPRKNTRQTRSSRQSAHKTNFSELANALINAKAIIRSAELQATAMWRAAAITALGAVLVACLTNFTEISGGVVSATSGLTRMIGGNEPSGTSETTPGAAKTPPESVDYEVEARRATMLARAEMLAAHAMATNCEPFPTS